METLKITAVGTGILMMLILNNVQCILVTKPSNAAVKRGDFVIMRCSSSYVNDTCGRIAWKHFKPNSDTGGVFINTNDQLSSLVTSYISLSDSRAGNCHLRVNATPSAAGRYQCLDGTSDDATAALIVLENVPEVKINQSHDNIIAGLECSVNYYGNWTPNVQWVKIVGNSWTNVTANESRVPVIIKNPVLSLTRFSSFIKIPSDNATEHFICNVTILTYAWKSITCGAKWQHNKVLDKAYIDGRGHDIGIGVAIGFVICLFLCAIIFLIFIKKWNR